MRTATPQSLRGAQRSVPLRRPSPGPAAAPTPKLTVLVAGLEKEARWALEACVREALGPRAAREPWTVSLVKLGCRWSITLHGPTERTRSISFTADETNLTHAIRRAVDAEATAPAQATAPARPETPADDTPRPVQDPHTCEHCERRLLVVYESCAGEEKERAPVACPYCWQINHVEIGAWAAAGRDYRCEKAAGGEAG